MEMKKKTKQFLEKTKIIPVAVFSSTDPTDLETGYADITKFDLTAVVAYIDGRFHVFSEVGEMDSMYVMEDNKTRPLPLESLRHHLDGKRLIGYDLEKFGVPLISHYLSNESDDDFKVSFYDLLHETYRAYEEHTNGPGKRFGLFNLAYWNACQNSFTASDLVGFTKLKMIKSWHFGGRRKGIRYLRNHTIWCAELAHRVFKHEAITVRDHRTSKKVKIPIKPLEGARLE